METIVTMLERSASFAVGFIIVVAIYKIVIAQIIGYVRKKHLLEAIKALNLEDKLATAPFLDGGSFVEINDWLMMHGHLTYAEKGSALVMQLYITELRKEGKIK